jgi:hypothetical protein
MKKLIIAITIPVWISVLYPCMELTRCILAYNPKPLDWGSINEIWVMWLGYLLVPVWVYIVLRLLHYRKPNAPAIGMRATSNHIRSIF